MNPSDEPVLTCEGLTCGYPGRIVLEDVRLELREGTSTVLLGPNGSGKSTLLKTLTRSLAPLSGSAKLGGVDLGHIGFAELAQKAAYVPQEELSPFRFTVEQLVLMGRHPLSAGFFDSPADHVAAEEAMRQADCLHLASRSVTELSGGERQRSLIARALAQEAPLLLLDEPTSHLDIGHQVAIVKLVHELCRQGRTVLVALHDLNLATDMGIRAILLHKGRVAIDAPTEEVLSSPMLDEAYGIEFSRYRDDSGRLRVFPKALAEA